MKFDAAAQLKGQLGAVLIPCPAGCQIGHDRLQAVLRHMLVEYDQVVKHAHHRPLGKDGRLLLDRHPARAVRVVGPQDAALLLG
jgi:hypothetical protein